jgi:diacylglycerol kinase (ATP)
MHNQPSKLVIIANPIAGRGRAYKAIRKCIQHWNNPGWTVELLPTQRCGHAAQLAEDLLKAPPDLVAVCGGDGTLNEIASRIPNPPFPIAVLPAGTANVVARELKLPLDPVKALQIALKKRVKNIDIGEINGGARRFIFVAGIGFDAFAVARVNLRLKAKIGMPAYAAAILDCLANYSFPEFDVTVDNKVYKATSCLACNFRSYGGGLLFCPDADMSDGLLDVLVIEGNRRLALAWFLISAGFQKPMTGRWIHRLKASSIKIEGDSNALVQSDGELIGSLPLEITLKNRAFPLIVK